MSLCSSCLFRRKDCLANKVYLSKSRETLAKNKGEEMSINKRKNLSNRPTINVTPDNEENGNKHLVSRQSKSQARTKESNRSPGRNPWRRRSKNSVKSSDSQIIQITERRAGERPQLSFKHLIVTTLGNAILVEREESVSFRARLEIWHAFPSRCSTEMLNLTARS